ncbi:MAG: acyl-CoA synthetase [Pseudohongiella sp.]|nr:MAG: acyl-CoA synthetase [Pseudohongiella sp.]
MFDLNDVPLDKPIMETLAEVEEFEKTPLEEQFPHKDSYNLIMSGVERFANDTALEFLLQGLADEQSQAVSYAELGRCVTQTANLLNSLGLGADDAVSVILPILPQTHYAIWGAQANGISNPINPMLEAEHIAEIMQAAEAKAVITLAPSAHTDIWEKTVEAARQCPQLKTILAVQQPGMTKEAIDDLESSCRVIDFNASIAKQRGLTLDSKRDFSADDLAAYFHTGGTTGRPKLAQLTHGNMALLGQLMQVFTAHWERQTVLCGLPLFHIYGVIIQGVAAFSVGYRVLLMTPSGFRSPAAMQNFWKLIEKYQVKSFSAVPTVLMALAELPLEDCDISCLTNINSGAAPLSHPFELSFEEKYEVAIGNGYGMTETTALISRAPENQPPGSVGMRVPYSQIRIAQLDGNCVLKDCGPNESGVILVKGPQVFKGYKAGGDNSNCWVEDGWFNTGDLGYLGEDNFLYLSGRAKDLIIRGGHNIDPELIEEPLNSHPAVNVAIAVGLPDPYAGELPMAFVVRNSGHEVTAEQLISYCGERISERAAIPKRIEFIDAMPLTAVGKIFRPTLREMITTKALSEHIEKGGIAAQVRCFVDKRKGLCAEIQAADPVQVAELEELLKGFTLPIEVS